MKMSKKKSVILFASIVIIVTVLLIFDTLHNNKTFQKSDVAMGTVITQKLSGKNGEDTADEIIAEIKNIENNEISWRINASDIAKINKDGNCNVSDSTLSYFKTALDLCKDSNGTFDITIGALSTLWNIGTETFKVPSESELKSALEKVNYEDVKISGNNVSVKSGQILDFGGIGKGIACDEAKKILMKHDTINSAVISVGGSILVYGKTKEVVFTVGIRDPFKGENNYMATIKLLNCCVSTSGDYEKFSTFQGKKYHHILTPSTGYPAETDLSSVTVICPSGLASDALSTACYILGYDKSIDLLKKYDAEAVFIYKNYKIKLTGNFSYDFSITNTDYTLV